MGRRLLNRPVSVFKLSEQCTRPLSSDKDCKGFIKFAVGNDGGKVGVGVGVGKQKNKFNYSMVRASSCFFELFWLNSYRQH